MHAEVVAELGRRLTDEREHYEQNLATLRRQVEALHGQLDRSGTAFREQLSAERHARRAIEARLRLLETGTPRAARQGPVPWLPAALTRMAYDEPEAAGRLALSLLPGQSAVVTERLNYDVELHGAGWYRVSVGDGASEIVSMEGPRPRVHADFRVQTDGAGLVAVLDKVHESIS